MFGASVSLFLPTWLPFLFRNRPGGTKTGDRPLSLASVGGGGYCPFFFFVCFFLPLLFF
jgi:hypothetical protein